MLGIDPKTRRKHCRDQFDVGSTKATAKVAEFLFRKATTEGPQCVTAAIFWMKTRGGWREAPQSHEIAVKTPIEMTDEELDARIRELVRELGLPMLEMNLTATYDPRSDE